MAAVENESSSPATPAAQRSGRRWLVFAAKLLAIPLLLVCLLAGLLIAPGGVPLLGQLAVSLAPHFGQHLVLEGVQGDLSHLQIARLRWQSVPETLDAGVETDRSIITAPPAPAGAQSIRIDGLILHWQPAQLWQRQLVIDRFSLGQLTLSSQASDKPLTLPASLRLPLAVHVDEFSLDALAVQAWQDRGKADAPPVLQQLRGSLHAIPDSMPGKTPGTIPGYTLTLKYLESGPSHWQGEMQLGMDAPFALHGRLQGESQGQTNTDAAKHLPLQHWLIEATAKGTLQQLVLDAQLKAQGKLSPQQSLQTANGQLQATLTPFAPLPVAAAHLRLPLLNPADWLAQAPPAALQLVLDLQPLPPPQRPLSPSPRTGETLPAQSFPALIGKLQLVNQRTTGRLPLGMPAFQLNSALHWQAVAGVAAGRLRFDNLSLNAAPLHLAGEGSVDLGAVPRFAVQGHVRDLDPAMWFSTIPAGKLGADIAVSGTWPQQTAQQGQRQLQIDATLLPGQWLGQPLQGKVKLALSGESLNISQLLLQNGPNQLQAQGRLGQAADKLQLLLNTPSLKTPWFQGDIKADLNVQGRWQDPQLALSLNSQQLTLLTGQGKVQTLQGVQLTVTGQQRAHQLQLAVRPAGLPEVALALQGGFKNTFNEWQGQLQQLTLQNPKNSAALLQLESPVTLALSNSQLQLGESRLLTEGGGQVQLRQLRYGTVQGQTLLQTRGEVSKLPLLPWLQVAGIPGGQNLPTNLSAQAAWDISLQQRRLQGFLNADLPDLAWLGALLGTAYKTGGSLSTRLQLGGTLDQPNLKGKIEGRQLQLAALEYQTQLEQGQLDAEWQGNTLTLHQLAFNSRLQNIPRVLQTDSTSEAALKGQGKLEASGQFTFAGAEKSQGQIAIRAERLGVLQQPTQWLLLSGNSTLQLTGRALDLKGKLVADAALFSLPPASRPRLSDDVHIRGQMDEGDNKPLRVGLDMGFDFGRSFYFQGAGLNTRLAGEIELQGNDLKAPRATGSIRTQSGTFDAFGRTLALERGILNFQGPVDNPGLNIRAVRKNLEVEAGVEVNGTVQRPEITLVSSPDVPDAEKLSWMILGTGSTGANESSGSGSEGLSDQDKRLLMTAASSLLSQNSNNSSGGVLRQIQNTLGIDEFTIDNGNLSGRPVRNGSSRVASARGFSSDGQSASSQIISVGKRLTSNLLLSYEQALGGTESIVKLTLSLGRRFSIVGRAGTDNALDLFYGFSFGR
jgi:translocation and assembly module TamB